MPQYVSKTDSYATGAVTGRFYDLKNGHVIDAPEGEFDHLHTTRIRRAEEEERVELEEPDTGIREKGGGWWDVVIDGELKDTIQGEDAARERLEALTLPEDRDE